jgi:hypothetical protein
MPDFPPLRQPELASFREPFIPRLKPGVYWHFLVIFKKEGSMSQRRKAFLIFICLLVSICLPIYSQSKETGSIIGTVRATEGELLPGAEVTISSPSLLGGSQSVITNAEGRFRFVALSPGIYTAEAKLTGFTSQKRVDIRLSVQQTLTVDFILTVGTLEEAVEVIAKAPMIDVKDSQVATTTMDKEFVEQIPAARQIRAQITFAAGSTGERAAYTYGSAESLGNAWVIDGVKSNSPQAGELDGFQNLDYDSIEEYRVIGQGTNAEYDGFQGAVVQATVKSGGNKIAGSGNFYFQLPGFHSENWGQYPYLIQKSWNEMYDNHLNLGGPIVKDKLWWYLSGVYQYTHQNIKDYTYPTSVSKRSHVLGKISWQVNNKNKVYGTLDWSHAYNGNQNAGPLTAPEAVGREIGDGFYFNVNSVNVFSGTTFAELKVGGFTWESTQAGFTEAGWDQTTPGYQDVATGETWGNFQNIWIPIRRRLQINADLNHHQEKFLGSHDFKLGFEFEHSFVRDYSGFPGGRLYLQRNGEPYQLVEANPYHGDATIKRFDFFAQDSWSISDRITINPGLRVLTKRGSLPGMGDIFKVKTGFAPRLGITFDLLGDHSTALKVHYGKYYLAMIGTMFLEWEQQDPTRLYEWQDGEYRLLYGDVWDPNKYTVDPNLKFPYLHNFVVGIERQLGRDISAEVSFIYRTYRDFFDLVNITGQWEPVQYTDPYYGNTYTIYHRLNPGENHYYVTNPKAGETYGAAFPGIVPFTPSRNYRGLEFVFRKRFSNRWQLEASYTYSRAWGSDDNSWGQYGAHRTSSLGASTLFVDPNWDINAEGTLTGDYPHIFKLMGSVVLPFDITLGGFLSFTSGKTYNHNIQVPPEINPDPGFVDADNLRFYGEEKGSLRYPSSLNLDLRLEKFFKFGGLRTGVLMDMFNVFNNDTVTAYQVNLDQGSRYPFEYVQGLAAPRTFRLGFRLEF